MLIFKSVIKLLCNLLNIKGCFARPATSTIVKDSSSRLNAIDWSF